MSKLVNKIIESSYHRNGVCGEGFYAIRFTSDIDDDPGMFGSVAMKGQKEADFLAILFDAPGQCAVICLDRIGTCGVGFAKGNSWRGDRFEDELRAAIKDGATSGVRVGPFALPTVD